MSPEKLNTIDNTLDNVDTTKVLDELQKKLIGGKLNTLKDGVLSQESKENVQQKASEAMKQAGELFKIDIPFVGEIGSLFGTKWPIDLLGTKEERSKNKLLNGVLKIFGFKNGMEEVHQLYIEDQLKGIDKDLAKVAYKGYKKSEKIDLSDDQKTRSICGLDKAFSTLKEEDQNKLKSKIPQDFEGLKNTLVSELPAHINKLNISTVNMVGAPFIDVDENNKKVIKFDEIQKNINGFVDAYLKVAIPAFVDPQNDFIASENINADTFTFALFGNLTGEKFFLEAVNLGLEKLPALDEAITEHKNTILENKKLKELSAEEAKLLANKVFGTGPATELLCTMSKDDPAMILRTIALGKHEGGLAFGRKNRDPRRGQINIGTFQISAQPREIVSKRNKQIETGKELLKKYNINYDESYFKKISKYTEETGDTIEQKAQTDLLVWLGYIQNERGGDPTFNKLADSKLKPLEVQHLISTTIQGGIPQIGKDVVAQINTASTDQYTQLA